MCVSNCSTAVPFPGLAGLWARDQCEALDREAFGSSEICVARFLDLVNIHLVDGFEQRRSVRRWFDTSTAFPISEC